MSDKVTSKGALIAYLNLCFASPSSLVAHCTITPSLNEVPRSRTTREFEVGAYRAMIRPTQVNAGAGIRCSTKIVGFPLVEAHVKPTRTMRIKRTYVRILLNLISFSWNLVSDSGS